MILSIFLETKIKITIENITKTLELKFFEISYFERKWHKGIKKISEKRMYPPYLREGWFKNHSNNNNTSRPY